VSFIDEFTHFAIVYSIKEKSFTLNKLKIFEVFATQLILALGCPNSGVTVEASTHLESSARIREYKFNTHQYITLNSTVKRTR